MPRPHTKSELIRHSRSKKFIQRIQHDRHHTRHYEAHRSIARVQAAACLTFIDLKKPFDSIETEAVFEALFTSCSVHQSPRIVQSIHNQDFSILQRRRRRREDRGSARVYDIHEALQHHPRKRYAAS
ncbi:unnamed protein product [Heligmosomoides polygyrus]|uniref:Reverse transcriptase domain-containing protein n=1 Tax=Heligmosomoides polygyrus TaxID=6339 RepID=A0A183GGE7_HELPZ|nr:unnamed protein product [Heligmosomoides polygyrus]